MVERLPSHAQTIAETRPGRGAIGLFWLGQAGFALCGERTTLVIDLYLADRPDRLHPPPVAAAELGFVDAFLATHVHRDHLDLPSWPALAAAAPNARFIVPLPIADRAAEAVPIERVSGAVPGVAIAVGDARITPVPALHGVQMADAYSFGLVPGEYRHLGYVVELNGIRVYHAGDTLRYDGMAERLRDLHVDVALLPINGRDAEREARGLVGNLTADEAADLCADGGVRTVIPMHYELIAGNRGRPEDLVARVAATRSGVEVIVLAPYEGIVHAPRR